MVTYFEPCDITLADILGTGAASSSNTSFINENYDASYYDDWDDGIYSIEFFFDGVQFENFGKFYNNGKVGSKMTIESFTNFEPGYAEFEIWDVHPTQYNLPFRIIYNQKVRIRSRDLSETYIVGRVSMIDPIHKSGREGSLTENRRIKIRIDDFKIEFSRDTFDETYPIGVTSYAIMKDVIENRTPFDGSEIDASKGFVLDGYIVQDRTPSDVLKEMLDLELDASLIFDPEFEKVYIDQRDSLTIKAMELDEQNKYEYVLSDGIKVNPMVGVLRNRVKMPFVSLYASGLVSVSNGSNQLIGVGTQFNSFIQTGAEIRIKGNTGVYTAQEIRSDTNVVISPSFKSDDGEPTVLNNVEYSASGFLDYVIVDDVGSVATMAEVLGENPSNHPNPGVFSLTIPPRRNPVTREQAYAFADAYVKKMTGQTYSTGTITTDNEKFPFKVREGSSIGINLPESRGLVFDAPVNGLRLQHTGAATRRNPDLPHHNMVMSVTDRRLFVHNGLERLFQQASDIAISDSQTVNLLKVFVDVVGISDCNGIDKDLGPHDLEGGSGAEEFFVDQGDVGFLEVQNNGPYYWPSAPMGGEDFFWLSATTISFWS